MDRATRMQSWERLGWATLVLASLWTGAIAAPRYVVGSSADIRPGVIIGSNIANATIPTSKLSQAASGSQSGYLTSTDWSTFNAKGSGSVTSVAASVPSWLSISGSPITSSGTLAITAAGGQTANQVLATPDGVSGSAGLRALVANDIPTLPGSKISGNISGNAGGLTSTLGVASGGTGAASFTAGTLIGSNASSSTGAFQPITVGSNLSLSGGVLSGTYSYTDSDTWDTVLGRGNTTTHTATIQATSGSAWQVLTGLGGTIWAVDTSTPKLSAGANVVPTSTANYSLGDITHNWTTVHAANVINDGTPPLFLAATGDVQLGTGPSGRVDFKDMSVTSPTVTSAGYFPIKVGGTSYYLQVYH